MLGPCKGYLAKVDVCGETGNETGILWRLAMQSIGNQSQNPQRLQAYLSWVEERRHVQASRASASAAAHGVSRLPSLVSTLPVPASLGGNDPKVHCKHRTLHFRISTVLLQLLKCISSSPSNSNHFFAFSPRLRKKNFL